MSTPDSHPAFPHPLDKLPWIFPLTYVVAILAYGQFEEASFGDEETPKRIISGIVISSLGLLSLPVDLILSLPWLAAKIYGQLTK